MSNLLIMDGGDDGGGAKDAIAGTSGRGAMRAPAVSSAPVRSVAAFLQCPAVNAIP